MPTKFEAALNVKKTFCLEMDWHTAELLLIILKNVNTVLQNPDTPGEAKLIPDHDKHRLSSLETLLTANLNKERG